MVMLLEIDWAYDLEEDPDIVGRGGGGKPLEEDMLLWL
jgi:hypothetical protein